MFRIPLVLLIVVYNALNVDSDANIKYEVILENATICYRPQPPYARKPTFLSSFNIRRTKDGVYLSGQHKVLVEVPFRNLTLATFKVVSPGIQEPIVSVENLHCRSWLGRMFLTIGRFRYSKQNCRLLKGTFGYADVDINKLFHSIPNWHSTGKIIHRTSLVYNDFTVFCNEISVMIKSNE